MSVEVVEQVDAKDKDIGQSTDEGLLDKHEDEFEEEGQKEDYESYLERP